MVVTLSVPLRAAFGLKDYITNRHLENMAKVILATGMIVAYGYMMEAFMAWYGHNPYEKFVLLKNRPFGPYAHTYWMMLTCNVFVPQLLWSRWIRSNIMLLWLISILVNIGMWLERYVIVVTSLHRDFLPSSWSMYHGTFWDYSTFYGTLGLFLSLMFLFIRFLPVISITEMRELVHETQQDQERQAESAQSPRGQAMSTRIEQPAVYGLMAEFDRPDDLIEATQHAYDRGYRLMEAYTPFPVDGVAEALGFHRNRIPRTVFIGGLLGGIGGFFMQWFSAVIHYPVNIGGRPLNSWPAFIPITFELTILSAAISAVLAMLAHNGLPRPHHPVLTCRVSRWRRATDFSSVCKRATRCLSRIAHAIFWKSISPGRFPWSPLE